MKKYGAGLAVVLVLLSAVVSYGMVEVTVFDEVFVRGTGSPVTESLIFPGVEGPAIIRLINGNAEDSDIERVSSSVVTVNREVVFGPSNFNQNVDLLEFMVNLAEGENTIDVLLKSKPGGQIRIEIKQEVEAHGNDWHIVEKSAVETGPDTVSYHINYYNNTGTTIIAQSEFNYQDETGTYLQHPYVSVDSNGSTHIAYASYTAEKCSVIYVNNE